MADTSEMPEMWPPLRCNVTHNLCGTDTCRVIGGKVISCSCSQCEKYECFRRGVLAERSRQTDPSTSVIEQAEKIANRIIPLRAPLAMMDHYLYEATQEIAAAITEAENNARTPVDAAAIRRAALEEAARLVRAHAQGEIKSISFGPEAKFDPEGVLEIVNQISWSRLGVLADRILALADYPPSQPVDDGWRSDMEAAPKDEKIIFWLDWADALRPLNPPLHISPWKDDQLFIGEFGCWSAGYKATHWRPLPAPPAPETPDGK